MQSKKAGDSVSAGTYTFKDNAATKAWAATMGKRDIVKYFVDARQQLGSLNTVEITESQTLQEEADALKAGYKDAATSKIAVSFGVTFLETIFKTSTSDKHAAQGGLVFTAPLSTSEIFEGDLENISRTRMLAKLESNRGQHQAAIDPRFPPDQSKFSKIHAVCSHILRKGYFLAVGFLQSIEPFYKMMTGAGLGMT